MLKILLLSLSRQYTVDGQYIPSLFIEPEVRHDKTSYSLKSTFCCYESILMSKTAENTGKEKQIMFQERPPKGFLNARF